MNKTLIAIATAATMIAGAAAFAAPANAGTAVMISYDHSRYGGWDRHGRDDRDDRISWGRSDGYQIERRINDMERRISDGRRYGGLSWREAERLNDRLNSIKWAKSSYQRSGYGLDRGEIADLDNRLEDLSRGLRDQRHDGNRW